MENLQKDLPILESYVKEYFKKRAIIPKKYTITLQSSKELWEEELKRVRKDELDYYEDFSDREIPLITDDTYAAAYQYDVKNHTFKIIDSYMSCEDFNYDYLLSNITDDIHFIMMDVYGQITYIKN